MIQNLKKSLMAESGSIGALVDSLDFNVMQEIVNLFISVRRSGNKVVVTGCGTSGAAAKKIAHTLCCVGVSAVFLSPSDAVHGAFGMICKGDVVVVISKGGNTKELTDFINVASNKQAKIIAVGENNESFIPRNSDIFLEISVTTEACEWNMLATSSTICVIAAFDAIALSVMHSGSYTKEEFLLNHPSGAVGEKLEIQTNSK